MADETTTTTTTTTNDVLTKGFSHNWRNHLEVDVAQSGLDPNNVGTTADFESLDNFMTGITPTPGDVVDSAIYWVDQDNNNAEVTGHARTWAVTGNVLQGDKACDFFQKIEDTDATGDDAKALFKLTKANGSVRTFVGTIENVVTLGGKGNAKSTMSLTIAQVGVAVHSTITAQG
jgi:hypothetical protein